MKTIGLIGCGAIGSVLAEAIERKLVVCDKLILFDIDHAKSQQLQCSISFPTTIVKSFKDLIDSKPTVIVEAASQKAVKDYLNPIVSKKINLIVMSTGALLNLDFNPDFVHIPSGAVGGLDALSSAAMSGIEEILLTTRKNPVAFNKGSVEEMVIYTGYADEAVNLFPKAMNVAATLALIVKPVRVKVQVVSDPKITRNTHEIRVKWKFGEMSLCFSNDPHPDNLHTSALAAWSAIRLLKNLL